MKPPAIRYFLLLVLAAGTSCGFKKVIKRPADARQPSVSIYQFRLPGLHGDTIDFSRFRGKKLLIVNTASQCGFTPQYAELQQLYEQYGNKVVILGFPANDFGGQEPGSNEEIAGFCRKNYGVTFPMFAKISVKGKAMSPLYQWLTDPELNGWNSQAPNWNFCKYLINENGELVRFYASGISPLSEVLLHDIR